MPATGTGVSESVPRDHSHKEPHGLATQVVSKMTKAGHALEVHVHKGGEAVSVIHNGKTHPAEPKVHEAPKTPASGDSSHYLQTEKAKFGLKPPEAEAVKAALAPAPAAEPKYDHPAHSELNMLTNRAEKLIKAHHETAAKNIELLTNAGRPGVGPTTLLNEHASLQHAQAAGNDMRRWASKTPADVRAKTPDELKARAAAVMKAHAALK